MGNTACRDIKQAGCLASYFERLIFLRHLKKYQLEVVGLKGNILSYFVSHTCVSAES